MDSFDEEAIILPVTVHPVAPKDSHALQMQNTLIHPKLLKFSTHYSTNSMSKILSKSTSSKVSSKLSKLSMCETLGKISLGAKFLSICESVKLKKQVICSQIIMVVQP